jgi:mRNA interferase HigB
MKIIAVKALREFWERFPDADQPFKAWVDEVRKAHWTQPTDIKRHYRNASILKNRRVVFNIKGNATAWSHQSPSDLEPCTSNSSAHTTNMM